MRPIGRKRRCIRTPGGALEYRRTVVECPQCRHSQAPLDRELCVEAGEKLTRHLVRKVAYAASNVSFSQASRALKELAQLEVSAAECARVVSQEGQRLDEKQRKQEAQWRAPVRREARVEAPEVESKRLVIEADASCVLTVSGEEHKSVYSGVAFDLADRQRKQESERPFLAHKRYTASGVDFDDFADRLRALACRMGLRQAEQVAFLADGAPCLWKWAESNLPQSAVLIQDFWHVIERLAQLTEEIYGPGEQRAALLKQWEDALRSSRLQEILDQLHAQRKRRRGHKRDRLEQEIAYLQNGRHRMDYARYEREGWPIGSGPAEGTCKHLVKQRFCLTGAHWRRDNVPHVLALRLSQFNEEWEDDWRNSKAA